MPSTKELRTKTSPKITNYSLKNYHSIRTPFAFFDETGNLNDQKNRFFCLGMLKCLQPFFLDYQIRKIRHKYNFYDEIKWNTVSKLKTRPLLELINLIFEIKGLKFSSIILNKDNIDFQKDFDNDVWKAYEIFTEKLLIGNISPNEIVSVIADYVSTPFDVKFEVNVKHHINNCFKRLAVGGICRVDSKGVNLIQITDLLIGAIIYDYKLENKLIKGDKYKKKILAKFKENLGIKSFVGGFRNYNFNIFEYKGKIKNGPSS